MKKIIFAATIVALISTGFVACKNKKQAIDAAHNTRNSIEWWGTYAGVTPAADCPGINVQLILNEDETYQLIYQFIDRDETPTTVSGKFTWDEDGGKITLDTKDYPPYFKVGENVLFQLDISSGEEITGVNAEYYQLHKIIDNSQPTDKE